MSNLKPAPLFLTDDLAAKLTGERPAHGRGIAKIRLLRLEEIAAIRFEDRQRNLAGAIAHLKRRCILVDVVNRSAPIRRYRIVGVKLPVLAEGVIAHAMEYGFEVIHA